jgi:spermidine/putrescine transport system permease protein
MTALTAQTGPKPARRRRPPLALRGYFVLLLVLLYVPIAILFVFSFNDAAVVSFPLRGFTLGWYEKVVASAPLLRSVWTSVQVAVGSSLVATIMGTMLALLLTRFQFRSKPLLAGLAVLPLIVPYVVLGVALLILFRAINVPLSLLTVGVAHSVVALPFTTLIVLARLVGFGNQVEEAAMDLGATYPTTLRLVILPIIAPSIIAAWLVAFTISFDEFALALFLAGPQPTFPVYLFGQLRFASTLPVLIAAAVMLMLLTLGTVMVSEAIRRRA